jgi:membrane protease YdiL (CAAX protease family)
MEPDLQRRVEEMPHTGSQPEPAPELGSLWHDGREHNAFDWVFIGPQGLRSGWSILLFYSMYYLFRIFLGTIFYTAGLVGETFDDSASSVFIVELIPFLSLLASAAVMALLEGRRIGSYNLSGPRGVLRFALGVVIGFLALSMLVGMLACGGWLQFDAASLSGAQILRFAALWGCAFLVVALVEEGLFRCYALFTVARGINFWWALATEAVLCGDMFLHSRSDGAWGVYILALLGFFPCLILHQKSAPRSGFWQAAWVTSTAFAFYHTSNHGENWIGVFAAGAIGFVFCLSVRLTGSAWWAIGIHTAWDWAETFFYGTADSGLQGKGHFLGASPVGNPLWSGGSDGPEGSLLVLVVILALFLFLLATYGRRKQPAPDPGAVGPAAN